MKTSRIGLSAGVAMLLAAPLLAQAAEPPAENTPPASATSETQAPQPTTTPNDHSGHDKTKSADKSKDGKEAPKPQ